MKKFKLGISFSEAGEGLSKGGMSVVFMLILSFLVMVASAVAVFFAFVHGPEQVMVPNVMEKSWAEALIEMQKKELYAKIQFKYSEEPGSRGTVIAQDPKPGAIVKAYRRVILTVSRGEQIERMDKYDGRNIDEVMDELKLVFAGESSLVKVADPVFIKSDLPLGTIIAQSPEEGAVFMDGDKIQFVVSSGDKDFEEEVPAITDLSIRQVNEALKKSRVIFDFELSEDKSNPKAGKIVSQEKVSPAKVRYYERVKAVLGIRPASEKDENVQGIFRTTIMDYPVPVSVRLECTDPDGRTTVVSEMMHPGLDVTVPYDVKKGSTLTFYVLNEEFQHVEVE